MPDTFEAQYRRVAARRFLFFLDPRRQGLVRIRDVLASPVLQELLELQDRFSARSGGGGNGNWFTLGSALGAYRAFLDLDTDKSGTLSASEFSKFADGGLTDLFVDRLFDCHSGQGARGPRGLPQAGAGAGGVGGGGAKRRGCRNEMDFQSFLDFMLAWGEKKVRDAPLAHSPLTHRSTQTQKHAGIQGHPSSSSR